MLWYAGSDRPNLGNMSQQPVQSGAAKISAVFDVLGSSDAAGFPEGMTVAEVARALGRDKSIVSRQLKSLLETELISRDGSGRYMLSWRLFALAQRAGDQRITRLAAPILRRLSDTVRERSHLTVWSGDDVLTVHSESSRRSIEADDWVGHTVVALSTASGHALLLDQEPTEIAAFVERTDPAMAAQRVRVVVDAIVSSRRRGYTYADKSFDPDVIGIGAPIRDFRGQIVAAINISGPAYRIESNVNVLARHVMAAARGLQPPSKTH